MNINLKTVDTNIRNLYTHLHTHVLVYVCVFTCVRYIWRRRNTELQLISPTCTLDIEVILIFSFKELFPRQISKAITYFLKDPKVCD